MVLEVFSENGVVHEILTELARVGEFLPWRVVRSALETPAATAGDDAVLEDLMLTGPTFCS
jgi:hypothetical protein